jgi:hypothetical protein
MQRRTSNESERPFPSKHEETEDQVDDLEDREGFYGSVEVLGEEVEEDFWPEESLESGCYLVCGLHSVRSEGKRRREYEQIAAVKIMRRAQWFLMSFPILPDISPLSQRMFCIR